MTQKSQLVLFNKIINNTPTPGNRPGIVFISGKYSE